MRGVFIFLAAGFEENEALAPLDVLRRGGVDVQTVSIDNERVVTSSHKVGVVADLTFEEFKKIAVFSCIYKTILFRKIIINCI